MKGFGKCVAVRICPRICCCGESISKNAFRRFESGYGSKNPEMHHKISKNFRVEKSGEISRNLRFSRFFVPASKSDTHHVSTGQFRRAASDRNLPGLQNPACKRTYVKAAESDQRLLTSVTNYITKYAPSICLSLSLSNDK